MEKQKFPIKAFIRIKPTEIKCNIINSQISKHTKINPQVSKTNEKKQTELSPFIQNQNTFLTTLEYTKTTLKILSTTTQKEYTFDKIFNPTSSQLTIFNTIKDSLKTFRQGYNVTIFCYGNTGAGKTYTMIGTKKSPGLIYNILKDLLADLEIDISYLEIYNEKIYDLLEPKQLFLRERENTVFVPDLFNKKITNYSEFIDVFEKGNLNRRTGETKLNKFSSRSHSILRLMNKNTKFYLVDLAGSENNRKTGNTGIRLTESNNINKSLFVLGNVVNSILRNDIRIPYRDSKLTRLLQDSIGGNSLCYVIANIIDDVNYLDETLNTLKFACKSRKIVNVPRTETININQKFDNSNKNKNESHNKNINKNKLYNYNNKNETNLKFNEKNINKINVTDKNILTDKTNTPKKQKLINKEKIKEISINNNQIINKQQDTFNNTQQPVTKPKNKTKEDTTFILKSSLLNNPDLLLTPTTLEKSYNAFLKRAQNYETEGNLKKALEDYKILKKIKENELIKTKILEITNLLKKQKIKKSFSNPREVLDILNSGNFVLIKQINGIGDKRAETVVEFLNGGNFFENLDDLKLIFSEKVVYNILECIEK